MNLVTNWVEVLKKSYAVWVGQLIGWATAYQIWLSSLSPVDQETLRAAVQIHWIPIAVAFIAIFGIPTARVTYQSNLPSK